MSKKSFTVASASHVGTFCSKQLVFVNRLSSIIMSDGPEEISIQQVWEVRGGHIKAPVHLHDDDMSWVTMPSGDEIKPCMFVHLPRGSNITQRLAFGHCSKGDLNMAHTSVIEALMAARDNARDAEIQQQEDAERAQMMEVKTDISFEDQHPKNKGNK